MLVLACPCSIVIAAPIPCVTGIATAARKGVIIKGSSVIEDTGKVNAVAVDKTGTLTKGHFEVIDIEDSQQSAVGGARTTTTTPSPGSSGGGEVFEIEDSQESAVGGARTTTTTPLPGSRGSGEVFEIEDSH